MCLIVPKKSLSDGLRLKLINGPRGATLCGVTPRGAVRGACRVSVVKGGISAITQTSLDLVFTTGSGFCEQTHEQTLFAFTK